MNEKQKSIESFGLKVEEVEPGVFKVLNTDFAVSITELEWELGDCVFVRVNSGRHHKKNREGYNIEIGCIYYIILECGDDSLLEKYVQLAEEEYGKILISSHREPESTIDFIPTIFSVGEMHAMGYLHEE